MPRIDPEVMVHRLNVKIAARPVRQKIRNFTANCNLAIAEEMDKLRRVKFIWEVNYPKCLFNVVLVKKASEN